MIYPVEGINLKLTVVKSYKDFLIRTINEDFLDQAKIQYIMFLCTHEFYFSWKDIVLSVNRKGL